MGAASLTRKEDKMQDREKLIERIKKLLAVTEQRGATEQEAIQAALIVVLPDLSGYRVFASNWQSVERNVDKYIYGDEFVFDPETTAKAERIKDQEEQKQRGMGEKHPCLSAYRDADDPLLLHIDHFRQGLGKLTFRLD